MKQMTYLEFSQLRESQHWRVIDVREQEEYDEVHVKGAESFPLSLIRQGQLPEPDERPLALICRSGGRSATAAQILEAQGFDPILNISDGTLGVVSSAPQDVVRPAPPKKTP